MELEGMCGNGSFWSTIHICPWSHIGDWSVMQKPYVVLSYSIPFHNPMRLSKWNVGLKGSQGIVTTSGPGLGHWQGRRLWTAALISWSSMCHNISETAAVWGPHPAARVYYYSDNGIWHHFTTQCLADRSTLERAPVFRLPHWSLSMLKTWLLPPAPRFYLSQPYTAGMSYLLLCVDLVTPSEWVWGY